MELREAVLTLELTPAHWSIYRHVQVASWNFTEKLRTGQITEADRRYFADAEHWLECLRQEWEES